MKKRFGHSVILEILHYLLQHPDSKDTSEGIFKWWLPKQIAERGKREVQEAVGSLVLKEWLIERETTPSKKIYGMNKKLIKEIRAFIDEFED